MSNLSHWNPFKTLLRVHPNVDIEDYLRGFGPRVVWADVEAGMPGIRIDVSESDKAYRIDADLPGATREDIEVSVDGNTISISAEIKRAAACKENEKKICSERSCGKVRRSFSLPAEVDGGKTEAVFENGVLTVTLPKKSDAQARRIFIG